MHVRTCASLFRISETAGRISLKIDVWLGDHWLYILHGMGDIFSRTRETVHTFKHIYPLVLVHRPKRAVLVFDKTVLDAQTVLIDIFIDVGRHI